MSQRGLDFDPDTLPPLAPAAAIEGPESNRYKMLRIHGDLEFWAAKDTEAIYEREAESEWCRRCQDVTLHAELYWYTLSVVYDPPLQTIDGRRVGGLEAPVVILWCIRHRGAPPARYPVPPPAGAKA